MEFSRPSCFLREIDPKYLEIVDDESDQEQSRRPQLRSSVNSTGRSGSAIDELRNRFDYRHQQAKSSGSQASSSSVQQSRAMGSAPRPILTPTMRKVGERNGYDTSKTTSVCNYSVGDLVEHPRFGAGKINAIETLSTDHKLIVQFANGEEKTLLAKFAKLTKL
ncbi:MAG: hypothetical protein SNF93_05190 [Rikenellaceae bacterium]